MRVGLQMWVVEGVPHSSPGVAGTHNSFGVVGGQVRAFLPRVE